MYVTDIPSGSRKNNSSVRDATNLFLLVHTYFVLISSENVALTSEYFSMNRNLVATVI